MSKVQQLKGLLDEMNYPSMMDVVDCYWYEEDGVIYWNEDNDKKGLSRSEGNTYSGCVTEDTKQWEGDTVANLDIQQGFWITYLFNNKMKLTIVEVEDLYE